MIFHLFIAPSVILLALTVNKTFGLIMLIGHCTAAIVFIFKDVAYEFLTKNRADALDRDARRVPDR